MAQIVAAEALPKVQDKHAHVDAGALASAALALAIVFDLSAAAVEPLLKLFNAVA